MTSKGRVNDNLRRHVKFLESMRDDCLRLQRELAHEFVQLHASKPGLFRRTFEKLMGWFFRLMNRFVR